MAKAQRIRPAVQDAITFKYNRGLVWATVRGSIGAAMSAPLGQRVQGFAQQVSCWRILLDCRQVDSAAAQRRPGSWPNALLQRIDLPAGARTALVCCTTTDPHVARPVVGELAPRAAVFTDMRVAVRWLRAAASPRAPVGAQADADAHPEADVAAVPLGAIKELLHQFARARRDASKAQIARELSELYRYLLEQADRLGIDPQRAVELYRAGRALRHPRLVRTGTVKARRSQG